MEKEYCISETIVNSLLAKSKIYKIDLGTVYKFAFLFMCDLWGLEIEVKLDKNHWVTSIKNIFNNLSSTTVLEVEGIQLIIRDNNSVVIKGKSCEKGICHMENIYVAFKEFIEYLSEHDWNEVEYNLIPKKQKEQRQQSNNTSKVIFERCLHEDFFINARKYPDKIALIYKNQGKSYELTYSQLKEEVLKTSQMLINQGFKERDKVAIFLPKGHEQIIAVLSILAIGAVYVPININQPKARIDKIINGNITGILTNQSYREKVNISTVTVVLIEERVKYKALSKHVICSVIEPAYIIFTSGSTGEPKGVVISHKSAYNTIYDVNERFGVTHKDRIITISELDFDLSVYDILGLLSCGGSIVIVSEESKKEPMNWLKDITEFNVTMWNSVPALFEMLLNVNEKETLRLSKIFLSGDWIKPDLATRILDTCNECRFIAMGGATEAAIWSIYFEVVEVLKEYKSIPYGRPLSNQKMKIVNSHGYHCPDNIIGELWIGGTGVAKGYVNDRESTKKHFKEINGELWYRTGDLARYKDHGIIEFIGRNDTQVKINGYRIELGEIEKIIKKHENICEAIAIVSNHNLTSKITVAVVPKIEIHEEHSTHVNIDICNVDLNEFSKYEEGIEKFLMDLCCLDNLIEKDSLEHLSKFNYSVLAQWLNWMQHRKVIELKDSKVIPGKRYNYVLQNSNRECSTINDLYCHIQLFKEILQGTKEKSEIFNYETITPEYLILQDKETICSIEKIIRIIKEDINKKSSSLKIGILGARTGMALEILSNSLDTNVSFTAIESSQGMINKIKERLEKSRGVYEYQKVHSDCYFMDNLYTYDFIIAIGTLHSYENIKEQLKNISLMLKDKGKLLAVEYINLSPVALVTSGILEDGFIKCSRKSKYINSPLLSGEEWGEYFSKSDFSDVEINNVNEKSTIFIEATISDYRSKVDKHSLIEYATNKLPVYMVPDKITFLSKVPLTENGKINRKKIKEYIEFSNVKSFTEECDCVGFQVDISKIWRELLDVSHINKKDSFFVLGGDSILATRFIAKVKREYNVDISLRHILDMPTLEDIAQVINDKILEIGNVIEGEI